MTASHHGDAAPNDGMVLASEQVLAEDVSVPWLCQCSEPAAATLATSQTAAAGVVWVDSVATHVKNAVQAEASAWLQMADDGVDAAKTLADDFSNFWNSFAHSYLGAAVTQETGVINANRQAAKDIDSQLTALASGIAAEQHDLTLDGLTEGKAAALALSPLDDPVVNANASLQVSQSTLEAWIAHANTQAAPVSDFVNQYPSGSATPSISESCLTASPTNCLVNNPTIQAINTFSANFIVGAVAGDLANNTGWGGIAGQTAAGLVPVAGQAADVRDTVVAFGAFGNGGWQNWGTYLNFAAVAVAWIPGMDWVKGGKKAATEIIQSTSQTSNAALRAAKEANGIPLSAQPLHTIKPNTPEGIKHGLDSRNVVLYEYINGAGESIHIRLDKPASFGSPDGAGNQGWHFNAGPAGEKLGQHHFFGN